MNSRIEKDFHFQSAIHYDGRFLINSYFITLSMLVDECEHADDPHIAISRVSYYIDEHIQNILLINEEDTDQIELYKNAGVRIGTLPGLPMDELFAAVLVLKLNSIMEGRIRITDITLGSSLSEGIRYNIVAEVAESELNSPSWYNKPCISVNDYEIECPTDSNVVQLFQDNQWAELGLDWKKNQPNKLHST